MKRITILSLVTLVFSINLFSQGNVDYILSEIEKIIRRYPL